MKVIALAKEMAVLNVLVKNIKIMIIVIVGYTLKHSLKYKGTKGCEY